MQKLADISYFESLNKTNFATVNNVINLTKTPAGGGINLTKQQGINLQKDPRNSINYQQGISVIADGIGKLKIIGISDQDIMAIVRRLIPKANALAQRAKQRQSYYKSYRADPSLSGMSQM